MNKLCIWMLAIFSSPSVFAMQMSQADYNLQIKNLYGVLEAQQLDLDRALDRKEHRSILVSKACVYSTSLKKMKQLSSENIVLQGAKLDFNLSQELDRKFTSSLQELGVSYAVDCKRIRINSKLKR